MVITQFLKHFTWQSNILYIDNLCGFKKQLKKRTLGTQGLIKERKTGQHWCKTLEDRLILLAELTLANCVTTPSFKANIQETLWRLT